MRDLHLNGLRARHDRNGATVTVLGIVDLADDLDALF